jgi:multicomponent Na+:H+ antiporter subunit G
MLRHAIAGLLLAGGVGVEVACCYALLLFHDSFDRLHFMGPATTVSPVAIAAAIVLERPFLLSGLKAMIVAAVVVVTSPILTHATARALRVRQFGHFAPMPEERVSR